MVNLAGDTVLVNGVFPIRALINNTPVNRHADIKKIASVSELNRGDYITWNNDKWLIISEVAEKRFNNHYKGTMQRCNYNIKFIFSDGIVREFPAIIDSRVFNLDSNNYITTIAGKVVVTMQANEDSKKIRVNKRFIKMGDAFKVVGRDLTDNGLLILTCELDMINSNADDLENEIADGLKYLFTLEIRNESASISVDDTLQLNVTVKLNDNLVTDKTIEYSSSDPEVATVDSEGLITGIAEGETVITAYLKDMPNVFDTISLIVEELPQDNFTYELQGATSITKNSSVTYTAEKFNNLVLVEDAKFDFTVIAGSTPSNAYTLEVLNDTQCKITAKSAPHTITLRATGRDSNSDYAEKTITLKNLF